MILEMQPRRRALEILALEDPAAKAAGARELWAEVRAAGDACESAPDGEACPVPAPGTVLPGRPARPPLVEPGRVPARAVGSVAGRAAMLHAIAHIEFNAINLALDAVWRFDGMPAAYYRDWIRVAAEEGLHFGLLREHLQGLGFDYGDFDAHDGLWSMAEKTRHDVLARMALVPRTLEARGLDASPAIQAKLAGAGDHRAVEILGVILRDEIGHVAIGNRWYRQLCDERGLDPVATWAQLAREHAAPRLRPPFNLAARRAAGFEPAELDALAAAASAAAP